MSVIIPIVVILGGILLVLLRRPIARFNLSLGNVFKGDDKYDEDDQRLVEIGSAILGSAISVIAVVAVIQHFA
jgi:hypothetical protein